MSALFQILFLIFSVKILGEASERAGFPSIMGEILAGILLGVLFLDVETVVIAFFAQLGAIFLLFTAGYKEVSLRELKPAALVAFVPTFSQIFFAFVFGFMLGEIFNFSFLQSLFIAVAFSPTSIGTVLNTLIDLNYLSSRPGTIMLFSAILDDIIGISLLSILITFTRFNLMPSALGVLTIAGKILLFLLIMYILGKYFFPRIFVYAQKMHEKEAVFSVVVMVALFSAYLAEFFDLHATIGAFIGGVLISEIPLAKIQDVQSKVEGLAYGILVPLFFAFIGFSIDLQDLVNAGIFVPLVVLLALSGKLIGGFIGSKAIGFDFYESLIFGIGVMPRAGIELVVLSIGRSAGIIGLEVFSAMVFMVIISLLVSPPLLKFAIRNERKNKADNGTIE
ncbi:TPA: cation:proton antiporter [Methanosarcina acetivorans]|uniref:NaH antiporter protein n=2 Tax=Methanosarcina acetivorans TaxID=2214 RepID=Q8TIQ9_METAC|nr:cation:proton antiporter [Methanosarcina acetivorans]AAM07431.1 NaH antiporter protein [Methanosarcina acetivorans C2A]HIH94718.1 cation:proton antiporter [Methanosarcina acetivorans]